MKVFRKKESETEKGRERDSKNISIDTLNTVPTGIHKCFVQCLVPERKRKRDKQLSLQAIFLK